MLPLYAASIFLSAALLFVIEPLFAKLVLPLLGGTPAVWATCMVFFQAALLAGYAYAHYAPRLLGARRQALLHLLVLALPAVALPVALPAGWTPDPASPTRSLLEVLLLRVGLPFFVIATTGPLVQAWFSGLDHASSKDPYFLYAASNAGSLLGLLSYPLALEPLLGLQDQSRVWTAGYAVYALLAAGCAVAFVKRARTAAGEGPASDGGAEEPPPALGRKLRWIALAAVPSSVMLGVTTYMTTDIGAVPLLWVIPLALYLLSFIVAFGRPLVSDRALTRALPFAVVILLVVMLGVRGAGIEAIPFHLAAFFVLAVVCHRALAADRPPTRHLTGYYLLMSTGGVVGGLFNALLAPVVFTSIAEYPIALVAGCLLMPAHWKVEHTPARRALDVAIPVGLFAAAWVVLRSSLDAKLALYAVAGLGLAVFALTSLRPLRFGLAVGALLLANPTHHGEVLFAERSFFAVSRVTRSALDPLRPVAERNPLVHMLLHGTTNHGAQRVDASSAPAAPREPLTYFTRSGPIGQIFAMVGSRTTPAKSVAVVGLGVGVIAAYAEPGQSFTYYEIDPVVIKVAEDARHFTYLSAARARGVALDVVLGDARLTIASATPAGFDVIFLDAFSSDAVPCHLVTREAVKLYLEKLAPRGILVFNVSNRYLELRPMLSALARESGLVSRATLDGPRPDDDVGKTVSSWVIMARSEEDLGTLARDARWEKIPDDGKTRGWTDAYSNILGLIRW